VASRNAIKALGPRVYGVVFLVMCLVFVWLTYAIFSKKFVSYDNVTLLSSNIGLSLPERADVKIRGVLVGEVLKTTTHGHGAKLTLGLYPDKVDIIPANVSANILPKTLFGEKYVALEEPQHPSSRHIRAGDTIQQSDVAIELEKVINDLFPLLRTVQPEQLNYTLTAVANALEGRGEALGQSLETLDSYLRRMNPEVPALVDDLIKLGSVSSTYRSAVPDLARLLRNSVTTTHTFESKESEVKALFDDVAGFSGTAEQFLRQNGDNIVTLANQGAQILPLLARYSPEYRCFLRGAVASIHPNEQAFRNKTLHIVLETLKRQPRGYNVADRPRNADSRGPFPYCNLMYRAANGAYGQNHLIPGYVNPNIRDGSQYHFGKRAPVGAPSRGGTVSGDAVVGTAAEQRTLDLAAAPVLGVAPDEVPDLTTLLLGPLARGQEVNVR
jgi:phospholipid/cholesterol/gamma-HCH transport system substrate-binding protein